MAKNFTHFSFTPFIPGIHKDLNVENKESVAEAAVPSDRTINNILNFSKALSVKRTDSVGLVEVVLN